MELTLGLAEFVLPINSALMTMNPQIQTANGGIANLPYTTEDIVSRVVKIAGSSYFQSDLDQFISDLAHHLGPFSNGSTEQVTNAISRLLYMLRHRYKEYQWYDSDGSCPWRFTGFEGVFNIRLGKPDGTATNHHHNHA